MNLNEYQKETLRLVIPSAYNLEYLVSGLCGEAGEVASLYAKAVRDGHSVSRENLIKELGDVLWFIAVLSDVFGVSMESVATTNLDKLYKRKANGTIKGSGDDR
jgi:NTP pyrophosphatase (non-canonical NTP hydrolase)